MEDVSIRGARLQDESGTDFLVISVPWESVATPEAAENTCTAFLHYQFPWVLASCSPDGEWNYIGKDSLTAICRSQLGQNPDWQDIPVSPPR
jgi:hypothetical protein